MDNGRITIHCDVQDTVLGNYGPTNEAQLILAFMQAAIDHGHEAQMVSTIGRENDLILSLEFEGIIDPFIPTLKKQQDGRHIECDILIDNDPIVQPFNAIAKHWIDPNAPNLASKLETIARDVLGFAFKAPIHT